MSDPLPELKKHLLEKLHRAKDKKRTASQLMDGNKTVCKRLSASETDLKAARDQLVQQGHIAPKGRGSYQLTTVGEEYLKTLKRTPPRPADLSDDLLRRQELFVLLQLLLADGHSTRAQLNPKFKSKPAERMDLISPPAADYVLYRVVEEGYVSAQPRGTVTTYQLTDKGVGLVASGDHYDEADFTLKLKGKQLTALFAAIRRAPEVKDESAGPRPELPQPHPPVQETRPPERVAEAQPPSEPAEAVVLLSPEDTPVSEALTADRLEEIVLSEFRSLLHEKHAHDDMVPIYELRRQIAGKYGPQAASHDTLDEVLMRLRFDDRIRLVAISNLSTATNEQLRESIQGMGEIFFSVRNAHEHAHIG